MLQRGAVPSLHCSLRPVIARGAPLRVPLLALAALGRLATAGAAEDLDRLPMYPLARVPSNRRALQTMVSDVAGLTSAIADASISHIIVASGHYLLSAELNITRSVIIEAEVTGTVVLDAGETAALSDGESDESRRLMSVNVSSSDTVQLIGLNVTGGAVIGYSSSDPLVGSVRAPTPPHAFDCSWLPTLSTFALFCRAAASPYQAAGRWPSSTWRYMATTLAEYELAP